MVAKWGDKNVLCIRLSCNVFLDVDDFKLLASAVLELQGSYGALKTPPGEVYSSILY